MYPATLQRASGLFRVLTVLSNLSSFLLKVSPGCVSRYISRHPIKTSRYISRHPTILKTYCQDTCIPYQDVLPRHLHTLSRRIAKTPAYPIKTYGQDTCIPYQDVLPRHLHTLSRRITKTYARDTKKVVMEGEEANTNRCECGVHLRKIDRPRLGPLPIPQARCR